ncbi:MAG: methyl-accepting chemotaxis protein [Oscillospiraceae bacterium]|nr:methyl-accepting chemotaxis protein [Oscillospiraceae bacterium]
MTKQTDFFVQNDAKVNKRMTKVLLWMTLVFPALFGLTAAGIFWIDYGDLTRLSCIGVFCTVGPFILQKLGVPVKVMKYVGVLAVGFIVMLLGMNSSVGIYMTYSIALLFSCMYYDKRFTISIAVITYIMCAISTWFRVEDAIENGNAAPNLQYIPYMLGFTIEFILMGSVFISVASGSHKLLENLRGSERVNELMGKCGSVSESLVGMMKSLAEDMAESGRATDAIVTSAKETLDNCAQSMKHVNSMQDTINEMVEATVLIDNKTGEMLDISDDICKRMESYVEQMNSAVDSMREIERSADMTNESIQSLEKVIGDITAFVKEITNIAEQTNILAINASIESSRAGEYGKGFSVVAGEIRVLAERSKASSDSVSKTVERVLKMLNEVKKSNEQNLSSVDSGISGISAAREAAAELGQLQADSRSKTEQIAESGKQTGERSRRAHEMAQQMEELVQVTYTEANAIVEETSGQKKITAETAKTFGSVKNMADELYGLSKM